MESTLLVFEWFRLMKREVKMIELVFDKIEKVEERLSKFKKKHHAQILLAVVVMYTLHKSVIQHEKEIVKLKKAIKELQSKGE